MRCCSPRSAAPSALPPASSTGWPMHPDSPAPSRYSCRTPGCRPGWTDAGRASMPRWPVSTRPHHLLHRRWRSLAFLSGPRPARPPEARAHRGARRRQRAVNAAAWLGLVALGSAAGAEFPAAPYRPATLESLITDPELDEISGLAASRRTPGVYWVHNDAPRPARLVALDGGGKRRGSLRIDGVRAVDWEDISAYALDGKAWLLVADSGDNGKVRKDCELIAIVEPGWPPTAANRPCSWPGGCAPLRDGRHDAKRWPSTSMRAGAVAGQARAAPVRGMPCRSGRLGGGGGRTPPRADLYPGADRAGPPATRPRASADRRPPWTSSKAAAPRHDLSRSRFPAQPRTGCGHSPRQPVRLPLLPLAPRAGFEFPARPC